MTTRLTDHAEFPAVAPKDLTYSEFLEWAPDGSHMEWIDGEVFIMSPASQRHQDLCDFLVAVLRPYVEGRGLGKVISAPFQMKAASHLPGREPDVLFIANDNLDTLKATFIDGPADLAIEIVSPESRGRDRGDKFFEYEQGGVGEYWLIDSERPWAEFYVLENDRYVHVHTQQGIIQSASIDGFRLHTEWVFSDPLPPTLEILRRLSVI